MISKIKLIKTFPNSPELGTEYPYNEKYKAFYCKDIKYTNGLVLKDVEENSEYYEIIYEPKFKVGDFVTDGVIEGFIINVQHIYLNPKKDYLYSIEIKSLNTDSTITESLRFFKEWDLKIASDTIKLFDKIYFENDTIWKCAKNGRKPPKQITIKTYLEYIKSSNIQHFEIFQTEKQAKEWFEENQIKYSKKDLRELFRKYSKFINYNFPELLIQEFIKTM